MAFEIVDEEAKKALQARGGKALERTESQEEVERAGKAEGKQENISDDVD